MKLRKNFIILEEHDKNVRNFVLSALKVDKNFLIFLKKKLCCQNIEFAPGFVGKYLNSFTRKKALFFLSSILRIIVVLTGFRRWRCNTVQN
jgi:hypothetical protein